MGNYFDVDKSRVYDRSSFSLVLDTQTVFSMKNRQKTQKKSIKAVVANLYRTLMTKMVGESLDYCVSINELKHCVVFYLTVQSSDEVKREKEERKKYLIRKVGSNSILLTETQI